MKKPKRLRLSKETLIALESIGAGVGTDAPTVSGCTCIPTCRAGACTGGTTIPI